MAVFSLQEVRKLQVQNVNDGNFASWPESGAYGYFGGGYSAFSRSTIDRVDFSNETISLTGNNLITASYLLAGTSNNSYGYFGGGYSTPPATHYSKVERIDFSSETISLPGNNLPAVRHSLAAVSSTSYGYFGGGISNPVTPTTVATVDRIDFSNETISAPGNNLPEARSRLSAVSSTSYGYFGGGYTPPYVATIDRIDFTTETTSAPGNNLPAARDMMGATSSSSYGYFTGGGPGPEPYSSTLNRIDFSNESIDSAIPTFPPQARERLAATSSSSYGYFGGGFQVGPRSNITFATMNRLDFSTETFSPFPAVYYSLSVARHSLAALSGGASSTRANYNSYGYYAGGAGPAGPPYVIATVDRIDFSNDATSTPGNNLPVLRGESAAVSTTSYGYFSGGERDLSSVTSTTVRINFNSETFTALPGSSLSAARNGLAAVSNSSYGFFAGGGSWSGGTRTRTSIVERIDFSNETVSTPDNVISQGRDYLSAVSSTSYGYFGGGYTPPPSAVSSVATVDRIDLSNETTSAPSINLPEANVWSGGLSNNSYGYFGGGGGASFTSRVYRIEFSNETWSLPGNNLSGTRRGAAATASDYHGYFGGGVESGDVSTVDRLDFSNETLSTPSNKLSEERDAIIAVTN